MQDLVVLVADKNMQFALQGALARPQALGIRPLTYAFRPHMGRDGRRACKWERQCSGDRSFDGSDEAQTETGLCLIVVVNLAEELVARCGNETRTPHRALRRASARTSSAA